MLFPCESRWKCNMLYHDDMPFWFSHLAHGYLSCALFLRIVLCCFVLFCFVSYHFVLIPSFIWFILVSFRFFFAILPQKREKTITYCCVCHMNACTNIFRQSHTFILVVLSHLLQCLNWIRRTDLFERERQKCVDWERHEDHYCHFQKRLSKNPHFHKLHITNSSLNQ